MFERFINHFLGSVIVVFWNLGVPSVKCKKINYWTISIGHELLKINCYYNLIKLPLSLSYTTMTRINDLYFVSIVFSCWTHWMSLYYVNIVCNVNYLKKTNLILYLSLSGINGAVLPVSQVISPVNQEDELVNTLKRSRRGFRSYFYNYLDEIAMSVCASIPSEGPGLLYAVRRTCGEKSTCKDICTDQKLRHQGKSLVFSTSCPNFSQLKFQS